MLGCCISWDAQDRLQVSSKPNLAVQRVLLLLCYMAAPWKHDGRAFLTGGINRKALRVSSRLTNKIVTTQQLTWEQDGNETDFWDSWCPCCKKPLWVTAFGQRDVPYHLPDKNVSTEKETRYAYVAVLWGKDPGFSLGALVLGQRGLHGISLRCQYQKSI